MTEPMAYNIAGCSDPLLYWRKFGMVKCNALSSAEIASPPLLPFRGPKTWASAWYRLGEKHMSEGCVDDYYVLILPRFPAHAGKKID